MSQIMALAEIRKQEPKLKAMLEKANQLHKEVYKSGKQMVRSAAESGKWLLQMKEAIPYGHFEKWLEERQSHPDNPCLFSMRTARYYMRLAENNNLDSLVEKNGAMVYDLSISKVLSLLQSDDPPKLAKPAAPKSNGDGKLQRIAEVVTPSPVDGGTEECLKGGKHEYDAEACVKCHDPRPASAAAAAGEADDARAEVEVSRAQGVAQSEDDGADHRKLTATLAKAIEKSYGELTNLLDQFKHLCPDPVEAECQQSLNVSYMDFRKWKKKVL
jgi:hypothetical protein